MVDELDETYDVPRPVGQDWVDHDQILPLLDGLDEVAAAYRESCVEAINAFRQQHGFVPMAVCSRTAAHEALTVQLRLCGAIEIQPLSRAQVNAHLEQVGRPLAGVRAALQDDPLLWELLESPLLLSIVALVYRDKPAAAVPRTGTLQERRQQLFAAYVEVMFQRRAKDRRFPKPKAIQWLAWLARSLQRQNQTELYLERMQPSWLPTPAQQRRFTAASALLIGLFVAIFAVLFLGPLMGPLYALIAGLFCSLGERCGATQPAAPVRWSWSAARRRLPSTLLVALGFGLYGGLIYGWGVYSLRTFLVLGFLRGSTHGLLVGLLAGLASGMRPYQSAVSNTAPRREMRRLWRNPLVIGLRVGLLVAALVGLRRVLTDGVLYGLSSGLRVGLLAALYSGAVAGLIAGLLYELGERCGAIRPAARLRWSWSAVRGRLRSTLLAGLIVGLLVVLLAGEELGLQVSFIFGLLAGPLACLLGGLYHGLSTSRLDTLPGTPNEGMRRSAWNASVIGLSVGISVGALAGLIYYPEAGLLAGLRRSLLVGLFAGLLAWLFYGGMACLQHALLRIWFIHSGHIPWRYVRFLDYAAERLFLRRVGGGYVFVHRLLLEHFTSLASDEKTTMQETANL
ncbi:MAG: NACHT domain-containing protein [Egibacteraceae bacterium]